METTRLSNKGQIVIPKQVRVTHGWEPGLEFIVEDTGDGIKLKPLTPYLETKAEELLGCVGYKGPKRSLKEMEAAIAEGARKKISLTLPMLCTWHSAEDVSVLPLLIALLLSRRSKTARWI